jgi:DUF4097 and DUF4098 domain-containing protein YvlB
MEPMRPILELSAALALVLTATAPTARAQQGQTDPRAEHRREREEARQDRDDDGRDDGDHDGGVSIDTTIAFATTGGVVDLTLISGEITVTAWTRGQARIHVSSEDIPVRFEHSADHILLDARFNRHQSHDEGDVQYALTVPVGTRVLMHSMSADLHARGTHGEIEARSVSGDVEVDDVVHTATIETVSGNVEARNIQGDLYARTVSGDVDADRVSGQVTFSSVSGHGYMTNTTSRGVRMETVSGDLSYQGSCDPTGTYELHAHSGNIHIELPPNVGATVSLDTFSGDIHSDFPMTIQPTGIESGPTRHHIDGTLGKGGARLSVETFSGDVELLTTGHKGDRS